MTGKHSEAMVRLDTSMEGAIAEETSPQELRMQRGILGLTSVLLIAGSIADGAPVVPHIIENLSYNPLHGGSLKEMAEQARDASEVVWSLGVAGVIGWAGLEFGDLAARAHRRLQDLTRT